MTKKLFFDTDCFSSFLWVNQEHLRMSLIDESEGNKIWLDMLAKKRSLPADSFTEYIEHMRKN